MELKIKFCIVTKSRRSFANVTTGIMKHLESLKSSLTDHQGGGLYPQNNEL